nr:MTH938/NDUFAF3 family protein [Sphingobium boeckii]
MSARFDREKAGIGPAVTGFAGTGFRIDGQVYQAALLTPERVEGWDVPALSALAETDVAALLALDPAPEFVLIGTGATMARPPRAFVAAMEARGIGVEAMDSRAAARAWAVLRGEERWIAAALMPLDA